MKPGTSPRKSTRARSTGTSVKPRGRQRRSPFLTRTYVRGVPGRAGNRLINPFKARAMGLDTGKRTGLEKLMKRALVDASVNFVEQKQIGPYWVDFYVPERNAVVEVDGLFWHKSRKDKDERRDQY